VEVERGDPKGGERGATRINPKPLEFKSRKIGKKGLKNLNFLTVGSYTVSSMSSVHKYRTYFA
jgi:hypothetical protein